MIETAIDETLCNVAEIANQIGSGVELWE